MIILNTVIKLILCHLFGDYVLQNDFIANSKGSNLYHLILHCLLYCLPFYVVFGLTWHLIPILILHIIVDLLKARYNDMPYWLDQAIHYATCLVYFI